jgi:hypothetical protein
MNKNTKNICTICRDNLHNNDNDNISDTLEVVQTKCGHKFHKDCLITYCKHENPMRDMNFSFIKCPLCNEILNCRMDGGDDIFPEPEEPEVVEEPDFDDNIQKALDIIPEEEYDDIHTINDIFIPELNLTNEELKQILIEIQKRKKTGGRRKRFTKRKRTNKRKRFTKRKRFNKRKRNRYLCK